MTLYISREASKLWKRLWAEITTEIKLLAENWKYLLAGLIFQYIHGLAARSIHYFHRPGPLLQDVGFYLLPELGPERSYISEALFTFVFLSFFVWTFYPFIFKSKRIYTVLIWLRSVNAYCEFLMLQASYSINEYSMVNMASQFLRIITFYSTQLPGPNYHCREGSERATLPRPDNLMEAIIIDPRGIICGCCDLIFSSHMIFTLVFVRTYNKYGARRFLKLCSWLVAVAQSLLIVASRKHYTVDVVVAWYAVNLVVFFVDKKLPELPDRTSGAATMLLPVSTKEKDIRNKEENHKLINGNSGDPTDRRQRTQMNGKIQEDANHVPVHAGSTMNGML